MSCRGERATFVRHLGRLIAAARHGKGMTAEQLAARAGIDVTVLRKIETGKREPRALNLTRIWIALKPCRVDDLMAEAASESGVSAMSSLDERRHAG